MAARWRSRMVLNSIRERAGSWESEREHSHLYYCLLVRGVGRVAWRAAGLPHPALLVLSSAPRAVLSFLVYSFILLGDGDWGGTALCRGSDHIWSGPVLDLSPLRSAPLARSSRSTPQALISAGGQYRASEFSEDSSSVGQACKDFSLELGDTT